ncbi:unnamed protein product [Rotaria sp. Silwood1]|nr:unnamed protein product [Rotaria sp. Silwood1]CAF4856602.1 unnamed protein product [Rotaria sp. Silwood1]
MTSRDRITEMFRFHRRPSFSNNFSLNKQILTSIIRPKTLATLRRLDTTRKSYLFRFLHESRLIFMLNPPFINLDGANLSSIIIGSLEEGIDMRRVFLSNVNPDNASFTSVSFGNSVFKYTRLRGPAFHSVSFEYVNFVGAQLQEANLIVTNVYKADFTSVNMMGAKISQKQINSIGSISLVIFPDDSQGRNPNLFTDSNCEKFINETNSQQNISINRYREWLIQIGWQHDGFIYYCTGWFDKANDL